VYRAEGSQALLSESESLEGENAMPGFACPLATIL
jgi:hypothetical protein